MVHSFTPWNRMQQQSLQLHTTIWTNLRNIMLSKKKSDMEKVSTVGFHLYQVQKQRELTYAVKNQDMATLGEEVTKGKLRGLLETDYILLLDLGASY